MPRYPWVIGLASLLWTGAASAQRAEECFPPCRNGYLCVDGACVTACNPPCDGAQVCRDGACVASQQPSPTPSPSGAPPASTQVPAPTAAPVAPPGQAQPAMVASTSTTQGSDGWVTVAPGASPQPPGGDRRAELRRIRQLFHIVGYVQPGLHYVHGPASNGVEFVDGEFDVSEFSAGGGYSGDHTAFSLGVAFGLRYNFSYIVGIQSRLYFDFMPSVTGQLLVDGDIRDSCGPSATECDASGVAFRFGLDFTFRFGPFAQAFPMYIGIGGFAGGLQMSASSQRADYNAFGGQLGGTAEVGFVFGSRENFDLAVRLHGGPDSGLAGFISLGVAFASL